MSQQHCIPNLILTSNLMNHQIKFINKSKTSKVTSNLMNHQIKSKTSKAKLISIIYEHIHNKIIE